MSSRRIFATAKRLLEQLRHDPRTVLLLLAVPLVLMILLRYLFGSQLVEFNQLAPMLIALFPFTIMFVVTSIAMLRERMTGTLERLLTSPISKLEILLGYGLGFGILAVLQVALVLLLTFGPLDMRISGSISMLLVFSVLDALMGTALGLLLSAFANSEFQAVQFLPAFIFPQMLLSGIFIPRDQMPQALRYLSDLLPLSYAIDGASRTSLTKIWTLASSIDLSVVVIAIPLALALGALTLKRQTN
ncbi:MAG: ABC transporter permease [Acidimicrobiaceae bacterium]|nr:ABC transporter permease [Acidimicrobiaceae bacterium]